MKLFTTLFRRGKTGLFTLILIAGIGMIALQSQENFNIYEDNPNVDYMPKDFLNYYQSNPQPQRDGGDAVITTPDGYDNFDIGVDIAEPHMSVNPKNPMWFFNAFNTNGTHYTLDGYNWASNNPSFASTAGDPWTAYDSVGNLYYQTMKSPITGTWTVKSTNNGQTWSAPVSSVNGGDRNTMAADQTGGPYSNYIYQAMTNTSFNGANFARSTDGGATFTQTFSATPHTLPGVMIAVGPNGATQGGSVYLVTYSGTNANGTYNFFRSTDGGATFTLRSSIPGIGVIGTEVGGRSTVNGIRTRPYPMIAADNSYGPFRGRLYCVYANNSPSGSGNKSDIFLRYSTDQGATWSSPVMVNDNANPELTNQWFPAVDMDKSGKLYIKWYDMRNDVNNQLVDVYATYTTTGGASFAPNQKLTNQSWVYPTVGPCSGCVANYRGDYDAISANNKTSLAVWFDGRNSVWGSFVSYFPDYAMLVNPSTDSLNASNGNITINVSVPSVKLYTDTVMFSAAVSPAPAAGTLSVTFPSGANMTSYPGNLPMRITATGGVTAGTYTVTVTGKGPNGTPVHKRAVTVYVNNTVTGVTSINETPNEFKLAQNYPNPFNPETRINFSLAEQTNVKITIYNTSGKAVATYNMQNKPAGSHYVMFNASELASGIYYYKMEAKNFTEARKMLLIK